MFDDDAHSVYCVCDPSANRRCARIERFLFGFFVRINNDYWSHCDAWKCAWFGTSIDVIKFHNNNKRHSHRNLSEMQSPIVVACTGFMAMSFL